MAMHEPNCVKLKRKGAEYVAGLLAGKSREEQLEFWRQRTMALLAAKKTGAHYNTQSQ